MGYDFSSQKEIINKEGLTLEKLKKIIHTMTDEDFNGNNGEDYFISVKENGKEISKSRLDYAWDYALELKAKEDFVGILDYVLTEAYTYDSYYYQDYSLEIIETPDKIFVIISYMSYV